MPGLVIDWMELEMAFESHHPEVETWLDTATGGLHTIAGRNGEPKPGWVLVEPVPSREQYRMMERFIATVVHPPLKDALQDAIVGKGAFRRFKDAVGRHPEERKRWFAFRDALLHRYILDWIKGHRLELQEMPAWNLDPPMTPEPITESAIEEESATGEASRTSTSGVPSGAAAGSTPPTSPGPERGGHDRGELEALKGYLQSWARAHGEEYRYLFGPQAFDRLAEDLTHEFFFASRRRP